VRLHVLSVEIRAAAIAMLPAALIPAVSGREVVMRTGLVAAVQDYVIRTSVADLAAIFGQHKLPPLHNSSVNICWHPRIRGVTAIEQLCRVVPMLSGTERLLSFRHLSIPSSTSTTRLTAPRRRAATRSVAIRETKRHIESYRLAHLIAVLKPCKADAECPRFQLK